MNKTVVFILALLTVSVSAHAMTVSQQWSKVYGGDDVDAIYSIIQTIDGGYIAAGGTKSFGVGRHNMWVLKLDSNGEIEWQKTYGLDLANNAYSIKQTSDGGYIVAGTISDLGDVSACLLKLDSNGNITWQRAYSKWSQFKDILQTSDGGYVAIADGYVEIDGKSVIKFDSAFNVIWVKSFQGLDVSTSLNTIQQTSDEGYIVVGQTILDYSEYWYDSWVVKLNSEGDIIWEKIYQGSSDEYLYSVQQTRDGGYIVAGHVGPDAWALRIDSNGNIHLAESLWWNW